MSRIVSHTELCEIGSFGARNTVYNYLRDESCPSIKLDGKWFVELGEFKKWYKCNIKNKKLTKTTGGTTTDD